MPSTIDDPPWKMALETTRELIAAGVAGLDAHDDDIFVVNPPSRQIRDEADIALDLLSAEFHRDGAFGAPREALQCRLPAWVRRELRLDEPDAPRISLPLASRGLGDEQAAELGATQLERELLGALAVATDRLLRSAGEPVHA
jgi:hypothetical protein